MEIQTIAIVGATELGRTIARAAALAGLRAILEDVSPSALEQGIAWITQRLREDLALGKISTAARDAALANLSLASSAEDASREADLIIETVSDEMEMKIELFTIFDKFAKPGAIFASTTSSLSITELAAVTFCPERCIGMRFSTDVRGDESLALVKGRETSVETIAVCREVGQRMGREVSMAIGDQVLSASGDD
ncbi:MAG TPA: 3-hydroxyacyl-CoA dehydrogenase NAD-binding domain-containing protein [Candidatus Acidoferrum sp.]|nr:3-hydroxyacyl-CoA dehydrogenase NAD-binding domain-containing protein [Candidatus Acidoferrum sp.]